MKIDSLGMTPDPTVTQQHAITHQQQTKSSLDPANGANDAVEDKATLSLSQEGIAALTAKAMAVSDVRRDRIEALRHSISNGQYQIEPEKIATAILEESPKATTSRR